MDGARAFAIYPVVQAFAKEQRRRPSLVLGSVLIHEIGHALGLEHQAQGVMRAVLHPQEIQDVALGLGFTRAEARQLRLGAMRLAAAWRTESAEVLNHHQFPILEPGVCQIAAGHGRGGVTRLRSGDLNALGEARRIDGYAP